MDFSKLRNFPKPLLKPEAGRLLLSEPFLNDGYFKRAVILLTEHNGEGTTGFILNKPMDINFQDIIDESHYFDGTVMIGGPVGRDTLHFVHTLGSKISNTTTLSNAISWGGDFENILDLISKGELYSDEIKFFIGYCGWSPGQLEMEIKNNSWFVFPSKDEYIMNHDTSNLWHKILKDQGEEYAAYSNFPVDPILN
jgi:putative transcriptional regulator